MFGMGIRWRVLVSTSRKPRSIRYGEKRALRIDQGIGWKYKGNPCMTRRFTDKTAESTRTKGTFMFMHSRLDSAKGPVVSGILGPFTLVARLLPRRCAVHDNLIIKPTEQFQR
jgi:hypothetical protein